MTRSNKLLPPPDVLCDLLEYDPEAGRLFWKPRKISMFKRPYLAASWNDRYAGQEAFTAVRDGGYRVGAIFDVMHRAHRVIWSMVYRETPDIIDHINGDTGDNRLRNLRSTSIAGNMRNMKLNANNTSGVMGVHKHRDKWVAWIHNQNKPIYIGIFDHLGEAVAARRQAERDLGYHRNHGTR